MNASNKPSIPKTLKFKVKPSPKFKIVSQPKPIQQPRTPFKFKIKPRQQQINFTQFVDICNLNNLPYFQFYDEFDWTGPAIKVLENEFDTINKLFNHLDILLLPGYGFTIIRPAVKMSDKTINYPKENYSQCKFTDTPIIPYSSDDETDSDENNELSDNDEYIDEEFFAEEWVYNGTVYLIDPKTNYLYSPSTQEFIGKKTSEFSIDFNAKEY